MTRRLSATNGDHLTATDNDAKMIKTYSFNSEEDNPTIVTTLKTVSNYDKLNSIHSPSIDSVTNEDDLSEGGTKIKRRKSRRKTENETIDVSTLVPAKKRRWYRRIDWTKPLIFLGMIVLLYVMWTQRNVWIPRLLTSKSRVRRVDIDTDDRLTSSKSAVSRQDTSEEDVIEDYETQIDNEEKIISSSKSTSGEKVNIRPVGRNKMKFAKDRPAEKKRKTDLEDQSIGAVEPVILSTSSSLSNKHHHHHHRTAIGKSSLPINENLRFSNYDDIMDQLRKNLKSRSRDKDFLSTLSKSTGLNKEKLHRFIYKKDYHLLTLETFLFLLETFDLMLLIVPK